GGPKVSDKVGFIKALLGRVDQVLIGGAMTYLFMKAQGRAIGASFLEKEDKSKPKSPLQLAQELLELGKGKILLPQDHVVVGRLGGGRGAREGGGVVAGATPEGAGGVDMGPATVERYADVIKRSATVVWNGPMGKFEVPAYSQGTRGVAQALADSAAVTVVGG